MRQDAFRILRVHQGWNTQKVPVLSRSPEPARTSEWRCDRHVEKISEHDVLLLDSVFWGEAMLPRAWMEKGVSVGGLEECAAQHSWKKDGICNQFCPQRQTSDDKSAAYQWLSLHTCRYTCTRVSISACVVTHILLLFECVIMCVCLHARNWLCVYVHLCLCFHYLCACKWGVYMCDPVCGRLRCGYMCLRLFYNLSFMV